MSFYDGVAGQTAVEVLIQSGKLVPDFWVRVEATRKQFDSYSDEEKLDKQVASAVKFAMGVAGVELPEWASPIRNSPDYVWIYPENFKQYPTSEPYYQPRHLYWAMIKSHHTGNKSLDDLTRQDSVERRKLANISWNSWKRLVPHFSTEFTEILTDIENERGNNGHTFSKSVRINNLVRGAAIRDAALYEFYVEKGEEGLKQIFHGIGQKAIFGIGAMMFISGEHDDLLPCAEKLESLLSEV